MNYFAHGRQFIDEPYLLAGTAVPDWLNVVDRRVRARSKGALLLIHDDARTAAIARGVIQHHADDDWFHRTPAFAELSWQFTAVLRDMLGRDDGMRPSFLGHILVELLLDSVLIEADPPLLARYYAALEQVDGAIVETVVGQIAGRPAARLGEFIGLFRQHQFLYDYADDEKLLHRLNQVMKRVQLAPLPPALPLLFPAMRRNVAERQRDLLDASTVVAAAAPVAPGDAIVETFGAGERGASAP
jgi:hypothetical protein